MSESIPRPDPEPGQWADPAPNYDAVAPAYTAKFLHELDHKPFDRELLTRFAAAAGRRADADHPVGDLGCGPGHVGAFVADLGLPVIGLDLSAGMVAKARECFPQLTFTQGDMTSLPWPDGALGGIVCFYALIHVPRWQVPVALGEMFRVLTGSGQVLVSVHGGVGSLHAERMVDQPVDLDATLFALEELSDFMESAGFEVVEAHERRPLPLEHPTPRLYVWGRRDG